MKENVWIAINTSLEFIFNGPINNMSSLETVIILVVTIKNIFSLDLSSGGSFYSIGSNNFLVPVQQQATIWTNDG